MIHLTPADFCTQAWANGRGQTVEMLRVEQNGALRLRLSMATVDENGPFSLFPGIERNLTVISGPGFHLSGSDVDLTCAPLSPVAFRGDVPVTATGVTAPSDDFNVMTAADLPRPEVTVHHRAAHLHAGGLLALFALGSASVSGAQIDRHDLIVTDGPCDVSSGGPVIAVRVAGEIGFRFR